MQTIKQSDGRGTTGAGGLILDVRRWPEGHGSQGPSSSGRRRQCNGSEVGGAPRGPGAVPEREGRAAGPREEMGACGSHRVVWARAELSFQHRVWREDVGGVRERGTHVTCVFKGCPVESPRGAWGGLGEVGQSREEATLWSRYQTWVASLCVAPQ